jgi:4-diphosphocytidyl-2-C-methyl-D-erythritol kinase
LVVFPNCKINLGLNIIAKRADGFHDLETVFYPIAIKDVLEVVQQSTASVDVEFTATGLPVAGAAADNLCVKAYHLLKKDFSSLPSIKMHLHKVIPMGAGLGGGSADGAFALAMLNRKFQLGLSNDQLIGYALQLGSDCPFFISNEPCFAVGRGEKLAPIAIDLSGYRIVVTNPGIHVNTGWAFSQVRPTKPQRQLRDVIHQPMVTWKDELINDFEEAVFGAHPEIKAIKENLYAQGAVYASMTGSGSAVYGIFEKDADTGSFDTKRYKTFVLQGVTNHGG